MFLRLLATTMVVATMPAITLAQAADHDRIQGVWQVWQMTNNGHHLPKDRVRCMLVKIDDVRLQIKEASRYFGEVVRYKLDPSQDPKAIDLLCPRDFDTQALMLGIYRFDSDDDLTICWRRDGGPRPKTFATCPLNRELATSAGQYNWAEIRDGRMVRPSYCPNLDPDLILLVLKRYKDPEQPRQEPAK